MSYDYAALMPFAATDRQREVLQAVLTHGTTRKAAAHLGVAKSTIDRVLDSCRKRATQAGAGPHYLPPEQVPPGLVVKGTSTYYDADGVARGQWVKTREDRQALAEAVKEWALWLSDEFKGLAHSKPDTPSTNDDIMCVYPMGDPHFGMYAWAAETGEDFDLAEADRRTRAAIDRLVDSAPASQQALFINLGDMFHADDASNRTPSSGHALDVDTRFGKVIQTGLRAMVYCIERLRAKHERVIYWHEIANHDPHSGYMLAVCLDAYYHDAPDVEINLSPAFFHYMRFGKVLIGATHGHGPKQTELPLIMAHDRKEDWGQTDYRYWYVGHVHHRSAKEHPGCIVETFRTLAGSDAWHAGKGYRSGKDMTCITLHRQHGEIQRTTCPLGMLQCAA